MIKEGLGEINKYMPVFEYTRGNGLLWDVGILLSAIKWLQIHLWNYWRTESDFLKEERVLKVCFHWKSGEIAHQWQ